MQVARLERERDAGTADVLVGLEGHHEVGVERLELAGYVLGLQQRTDRMLVFELMHDPREVALV